MQFLNIDQALADLAHFIVYIRGRHPEYADSEVIMIGGSYSATMVAWFRQKYPHLVAGACNIFQYWQWNFINYILF